jgi:predicted amidohydrolase
MDLNDDQFVYWLNAAGVDVLAFPTNWIDQGEEVTPYWKWRLSPWSGWLVAANRWGSDEFLKFKGNSAIISPNKEVVALAGESGDEVLVYDTVARVEVGPKTRPQSQTQA